MYIVYTYIHIKYLFILSTYIHMEYLAHTSSVRITGDAVVNKCLSVLLFQELHSLVNGEGKNE